MSGAPKLCCVRGCLEPGLRSRCPCKLCLCVTHGSSVRLHDCPESARLDRIASDPRAKREWLSRGNEHEWSAVVAKALNESGLGVFWQGKKRGGVRASKVAMRVPDVIGYSLDGDARFVCVELKNSHGEECNRVACGCKEQREWGVKLNLFGGVFLLVPMGTDCTVVVAQVRLQLQERRDAARRSTG